MHRVWSMTLAHFTARLCGCSSMESALHCSGRPLRVPGQFGILARANYITQHSKENIAACEQKLSSIGPGNKDLRIRPRVYVSLTWPYRSTEITSAKRVSCF